MNNVSRKKQDKFKSNNVKDLETIQCYLKEIARYPLLTPEEEAKYANDLTLIKHSNIVNQEKVNQINVYNLKLDVILYALCGNDSYKDIIEQFIKFFYARQNDNDKRCYQFFKKYKDYTLKLGRALNEKEINDIFSMEKCDVEHINLSDEVEKYMIYRKAYDIILNSNLRLVVSIAKNYINYMDIMDLISEGNIGLMKAIDRYDVSKEFKLSTYATWWIKQNIKRSIDNQQNIIRMPAHYSESLVKFRRAVDKLEKEYQRRLEPSEIAKILNISLKKVEKYFSNMHVVVSLNQPVGEEDETDLINFIISDADIDEEIDKHLLCEDIQHMLELMSDMKEFNDLEIKILKMRYGLDDYRSEFKTYNEIARNLGVSNTRVRMIETKALRKIRFQTIVHPEFKILQYYLK